MLKSKDAVIALLSVDFALNVDQIKNLQQNLSESGFTINADRYGEPDGSLGRLTRSDINDFIKDNPESLLTISTTMAQLLSRNGFADTLQEVADNNPEIKQALASQAKEILNGRSVDALNNTPELKELQTKLKLLGEYNGAIDGITGRQSRSAVTALQSEFAQAAAPSVVETPQLIEQTAPETERSEPEAQPVESAPVEVESPQETVIESYMGVLGFDERGLMMGDGGEANWNNKRDPQVWNLQVLLNRAGADILVDGDYGSGTQRAVRAFQEEHGLPATGQADFETLKTLASLPETQFSTQAQDNSRNYTIIEHHKILADTLPQVENDTGVSAGYLMAVRGKETHFGTDMNSGTGSRGPHQFTGRTFDAVVNRYGEKIAENLRGIGQNELADRVLQSQAGDVDRSMRYDPYVSAYAAAYLTKENGIDTSNANNWGDSYATHNIGRGGYNTVNANRGTSNVGAVVDRKYPGSTPAANNPYFFRGGASGATVLNRYQDSMETWRSEYDTRVLPQLEALQEMQTAQLTADATAAQTMTAPALETGKPF